MGEKTQKQGVFRAFCSCEVVIISAYPLEQKRLHMEE